MLASHVLAALLVIACLVFAFIARCADDVFYLRLATEALIFAGLALSVDILLGYTGLLSLGQALYFGLGAYTSALALRSGISFAPTMAIVLAVSLAVSLAGGVIVHRVGGGFFAPITFCMGAGIAEGVFNKPGVGASYGLVWVAHVPDHPRP